MNHRDVRPPGEEPVMRHLPRLLLAASLLLPAATLADSLRCPGGIVSVVEAAS